MTSSPADRLAEMADELEIRRLIENWALFRDTGDFDRFAELWHPEGWMVATWFQAGAADFIARSRQAFARQKGMHILGGSAVATAPPRAVAQTRMRLSAASGSCGIASRSMSSISYDRSIRMPRSAWIPSAWRASRRATGIWPTCRAPWGSKWTPTFQAPGVLRSRR